MCILKILLENQPKKKNYIINKLKKIYIFVAKKYKNEIRQLRQRKKMLYNVTEGKEDL